MIINLIEIVGAGVGRESIVLKGGGKYQEKMKVKRKSKQSHKLKARLNFFLNHFEVDKNVFGIQCMHF